MEKKIAAEVEEPLSKATEDLDVTKDRLATALKDWQDKVQQVEMHQSEESPSTLDDLEAKDMNEKLQNHVDETKEYVVGAVRDWVK